VHDHVPPILAVLDPPGQGDENDEREEDHPAENTHNVT
jgi:hypothetical protein